MYVFLFDIDGTLIDSGGAGKASLDDAMCEEFRVERPAEVHLHGCTDRSIARSLFESHGITDNRENFQRFCAAYLRRLPHWLQHKNGRILPGVCDLLAWLSQRDDVALGLLTGNVARGAQIKLEHFGLYDYFEFGGYGDVSPDRHEVARAALAAAQRDLQTRLPRDGHVDPNKTYVVGDTPHDIRCARAIGAREVAVSTGYYGPEELAAEDPHILLEDLGDLHDHLDLPQLPGP